MITLNPIVIRGAAVTSSTIPALEADEVAWTTSVYAVGDTVSYAIGTLTYKFECKLAHTGAAGKEPEAFPDDEANLYWIDLGAINRYAMFQLERNTQSIETASPLIVEVNPGDRVGAVGLGNLVADDVTLDIYDSGAALVSTETKQLLTRYVYDGYDYFFTPFRQVKDTIFDGLAMNTTHTFKLTFTKASGSIKVGSVTPGTPFNIGSAQYQAKVRRLNFSSFTRTFDGETKITLRRSVPKVTLRLIIDKARVNAVQALIDDLNGVVAPWAGIVETTDGYFESVFIVGLYKDFQISLDYPNHAVADIEIEAM